MPTQPKITKEYLQRALKILRDALEEKNMELSNNKLLQLFGYLEGGIDILEQMEKVKIDKGPQC